MSQQAHLNRIEEIRETLWRAGIAFGKQGEERLWSISPEPLILPLDIYSQMQEIAIRVPHLFGVYDWPYYIRFDVTIDPQGKVWILEANEVPVGDRSVDINRTIYDSLGYTNAINLPGNIPTFSSVLMNKFGSRNIALVIPSYRAVYQGDYESTAARMTELGHPAKVVLVKDFCSDGVDLIYRVFTYKDLVGLFQDHDLRVAVNEGIPLFPLMNTHTKSKTWMAHLHNPDQKMNLDFREWVPFTWLMDVKNPPIVDGVQSNWGYFQESKAKADGWVIKPAGTNWGAKGVTISNSKIKLHEWKKALSEALQNGGYIFQKRIQSQKYPVIMSHAITGVIETKLCNVRLCVTCLVDDSCQITEVDAALSHRTIVHGGIETAYMPVYFK